VRPLSRSVEDEDTAWPRISIVTPSYNQGQFIEDTICSVLGQHYPNLEYIVMDGGSTDNSVEIIRRYEQRLAFWTSEKDGGAADAIAKGFSRATGSILGYLNSDDTYKPDALEAVAETMLHSRADVVYGNTYWINSNGEKIGERRQTPFVPSGYLYGGFDLQQPATFWSKAIYEKVGGMDPSYRFAFDTEMFVRFVREGAKFKYLHRALANFRIHPQSKSSTQLVQCAVELQRLRSLHLPHSFDSFHAQCARNYTRFRRTLWYLLQGDLWWLAQRIPDRLKARHSGEIVGPRSKWM